MQHELNALASTLAGLFARTGTIPGPSAKLGKGDGAGTLLVPNTVPQLIYLHDNVTNQQYYAYLPQELPLVLLEDGHPEIESIRVDTGYKWGSKTLTVLGVNNLEGQQAVGTLSPFMAQFYRAYYAAADQITILRPYADTPASYAILADVNLSLLQPSTNTLNTVASLRWNLGPYITALAAGKHQLLLPYYNRETFLTGVLAQTAVSSTAALGSADSHDEFTAADMPNFTRFTSDMLLSVPLDIYYGMPSVTESAFYRMLDARGFLGGGAANDFNRIVTSEAYDVVIGEDGNVVYREAN